ncbi:MAG: tetratricopeptide repeat protein [Acidobacteriota bacterium]|nr:tetratricopeptide repeat protein [Acidobacteriota bacterium]
MIVGVGAFYLGSQWNKPPRENQGSITTPVSSDAAEPTTSGQARTGTPDTTATTQPAASQPTTPTHPNAPPTTLREQPTASSQPAHPPEKRRTTDAPPTATESPVKAKTKSTTSAKEYYDQGIEDLNAGRYDAALEKFEQVKRLSPDNKDVYYLIGQAYHKSKRLAEALRAYEQCTSGPYASLAAQHVKALSKQLKKSN